MSKTSPVTLQWYDILPSGLYTIYLYTAGWKRITKSQMEYVYQGVYYTIIIKISASAMPWSHLELLVLAR